MRKEIDPDVYYPYSSFQEMEIAEARKNIKTKCSCGNKLEMKLIRYIQVGNFCKDCINKINEREKMKKMERDKEKEFNSFINAVFQGLVKLKKEKAEKKEFKTFKEALN